MSRRPARTTAPRRRSCLPSPRSPDLESLYFVTHDVDLALTHADRILVLRDGRIVADGPPVTVIEDAERWRASNLHRTSLMAANQAWAGRIGPIPRRANPGGGDGRRRAAWHWSGGRRVVGRRAELTARTARRHPCRAQSWSRTIAAAMWEVTTRVIVYAAIGAALYGVAGDLQLPHPRHRERVGSPGVRARHVLRLRVRADRRVLHRLRRQRDRRPDQRLGPAHELELEPGQRLRRPPCRPVRRRGWRRSIPNRLLLAAVAAGLAVVVGFLFVFTDIWLGTADRCRRRPSRRTTCRSSSRTSIAAAILTPILVAAWEPIKESMGR